MNTKPLKRFCVGGPEYGLNIAADQYADAGIRLLRTTDIDAAGKLASSESAVFVDPSRVRSEGRLQRGDLLLSRSGTLGRAFLVPDAIGQVTYAGYLVRFRPAADSEPRYLWYCAQSQLMQDAISADAIQSTIGNFNGDKYANVRLPVWPLEEQRAIADYLDRETARIDALIATKEQMVELAEERLDAMRVEMVFARPDVRSAPLKRLASCLPGLAFASDGFVASVGNAVRLLRGVNVTPTGTRWNDLVSWPLNRVTPAMAAYSLRVNDLVVGMDRPWIGSGTRIAKLRKNDIPSLLVQRVARIRPIGDTDVDYIRHALLSSVFRSYFEPVTTGVSVPHISEEQIMAFRVPDKTGAVQREISAQINREEQQVEAVKAAVSSQTLLLCEHRQALITAAVTGQLEVPVAA